MPASQRISQPVSPAPTWVPRGLRLREAAAYIGVSRNTFLRLVADGQMPQPRRTGGCVIYDRLEIDAAFDELPQDGASSSANGENSWDE